MFIKHHMHIALFSLAAIFSAQAYATTDKTDLNINETGISAAEKGYRIIQTQANRDEGWVSSESDMEMILRNAKGDESVRQMRSKALEVLKDGDKSLSIFDQPKDVKGTAFLTFAHVDKPDDQWLYLPALKRVKRINSRNKSGPFMGSEFSFEDMSAPEVSKYTYKFIGLDTIDGVETYKIETYPKDKTSGYTKRVVWVDTKDFKTLKVDFYDRKKSLLKTLTLKDYKLFLNKHWRSSNSIMVNHQSGKSTELKLKNNRFNTGLKDKDFDKNSLKRLR